MARNPKLRTFVRLLIGGCALGLLFGHLVDTLGWSELLVERRILGHRAGFPALGIAVPLFFSFAGLIFGVAYVIHDNKFWKAVVEVAALFGGSLLMLFVIIASRGAPPGPAPSDAIPPVVDSMFPARGSPAPSPPQAPAGGPAFYPMVETRDGSDVEHLGSLNNVIRIRPGRTQKHPVQLINQGQSWWIGRELCRLGRNGDSPAVVSTDRCVTIPRVPPGESVIVTIEIAAPLMDGRYRAFWKMVNSDGEISFPGAAPLTLHVVVQ